MSKYMTHADTLRGMAKAFMMVGSHEQAGTCLAGAGALETLAFDTLEYRVEHQHIDNGAWHPVTKWSHEWPLREGHTVAPDERIMCRRVSEPWEVTE